MGFWTEYEVNELSDNNERMAEVTVN